MRILALVEVDFRADFFGAPSTLAEPLAGRPVLTRTLQRLAAVEGLDGIVVSVWDRDADRVRQLAGDVPVQLALRDDERTGLDTMRPARTFGRYGWRGGLAGATVYDELYDPRVVAAVLDGMAADALFLVAGGSALLDVKWACEMVDFHRKHAGDFGMGFCQAPPGLGGMILGASALRMLAREGTYPGRALAYDPNKPVNDPISQPSNYTLPDELIATYRRFIADCPRGLWLCGQLIERGGEDIDGEDACRISRRLGIEPWPREITVELTTRRPIEDDLRPAADRADLSIERLTEALAGLEAVGDLNIMLAGAGDALLHPRWTDAVAVCRKVGRVGAATYGLNLDDKTIDAILSAGLDVLEVYVDAMSDEVYAAHKRGGSAEAVWANLARFAERKAAAGTQAPLVVPTMLKTPESLDEQDEFFQTCLQRTGWGFIQEPTQAAGQWPDRGVVDMAPPDRTACRRLNNRLTLLSDGQVVPCEEDIQGSYGMNGWPVAAAWVCEGMRQLRAMHAEWRWDEHPLCAACREFHRP